MCEWRDHQLENEAETILLVPFGFCLDDQSIFLLSRKKKDISDVSST
jgi:hypothetical protein